MILRHDTCARRPRVWSRAAALGLIIAALTGASEMVVAQPGRDLAMPERVQFASADQDTTLVGYVFKPVTQSRGRVPAVVMMHGRAGAYSSLANGKYDATTLSQRHQFWGRLWASQGYLAILVDGFGPRGYPQGFGRFSYKTRPVELDEVTRRPLDAYGALAYLRSRPDVMADRIALQGWSNGASATLASMAPDAPGATAHDPAGGFRAALAFYPRCQLKGSFTKSGYDAYAPLRVFVGTADEEISPQACAKLLDHAGPDIALRFYDGATHDFDDPGAARQKIAANAQARQDVIQQSVSFFASELVGKRGR